MLVEICSRSQIKTPRGETAQTNKQKMGTQGIDMSVEVT